MKRLINFVVYSILNADNLIVESESYPAPYSEWMLTDQCGLTATGSSPATSNAPAMQLTAGITYQTSQSALQGNALRLNGDSNVFANTATSSLLLNLQYMTAGYSCGAWLYLEQFSPTGFAICEFFYASGSSVALGSHFWLFQGGFFYHLRRRVVQ